MPLLNEYNKLVSKLPTSLDNEPSLAQMKKEQLSSLDLTDQFWDLDHLECREKWATDPALRLSMKAFDEYTRAVEEVNILIGEVERYVNAQVSRLNRVKTLLQIVSGECMVRSLLLEVGEQSYCALQAVTTVRQIYKKLPVFLNKKLDMDITETLESTSLLPC